MGRLAAGIVMGLIVALCAAATVGALESLRHGGGTREVPGWVPLLALAGTALLAFTAGTTRRAWGRGFLVLTLLAAFWTVSSAIGIWVFGRPLSELLRSEAEMRHAGFAAAMLAAATALAGVLVFLMLVTFLFLLLITVLLYRAPSPALPAGGGIAAGQAPVVVPPGQPARLGFLLWFLGAAILVGAVAAIYWRPALLALTTDLRDPGKSFIGTEDRRP